MCFVAAGATAGLVCGSALGQDRVVASLPWAHGTTAGPNGTNYEPPNEGRGLWVVEDFGITSDAELTRFESYGTIFPAPLTLIDMTVRIYDALPTTGNLIMSSLPGTGRVIVSGLDYRLVADFGGQRLPAGNYYVVWQASTHTGNGQIAIFWAQGGPHSVGGGGADNAWQWNPGGVWGYPNNIRPVPADLSGNGQTGANFTLYARGMCYPNCDASTTVPVLNVNDFICFQGKFAGGDLYANCDGSSGAPYLNVSDFICFLTRYAGGCP